MSKLQVLNGLIWGFLLVGICFADPPNPPVASAPYKLPPQFIEQARKAAAIEVTKAGDPKQRRPKGLETVESAESIQLVIERAMPLLASENDNEATPAIAQLRYLGEHAFEALVVGAKSEDLRTSYRCCHLLSLRGGKAIGPLCDILKSGTKSVSAAARALQDMDDPVAVPRLIEVLIATSEPLTRSAIARALMHLKDSRAVEPLRQFGKDFEPEIQQILSPNNFVPWPTEQLAIRQLCHDAKTLAGEAFGPNEARQIASLLDSRLPQVQDEASQALIALRDVSVIPAAIKHNHWRILASVPTPAAIEVLIAKLQSPSVQERQAVASAVAYAGRWGIPLVVGMLDDSAQFRAGYTHSFKYAETREKVAMPETHGMHRLLHGVLRIYGLPGRSIDVAKNDQRVSVKDDIAHAKVWWSQHGEDFLAGKDVPNPNLTVHRDRR